MLRHLLKSDWDQPYRMIYRFFLLLLAVSLLLYLAAFFNMPYNGLDWYVTATTEVVKIPLHQFSLGLFTVDLLADNFLIKQYFEGSPFQFEAWDTYLYLIFLALGLSLLLTITTYFSTFWFTLSMGVFTILLISMQWQQLQLFGFQGREPLIGIAALFLGVSYLYQAWQKYASMTIRLISFFGLFGVLALLIFWGSNVNNPFMHLAHYGVFVGVLISILFVFFVAHEIVYLILYLITQARPDKSNRNAAHFLIFSLIYLGNIFLIYLRNGGYIDWDILYVNAFVLIIISLGIALWSFEKKEEAYGAVFAYNPLGGLFLLALAVIAFTSIRYQMVMANDPLLETFEDTIVFSHLGFGAMFFIYVIANYITPLIRNLQVYKIVYKEGNFPYATATLASLVVVLALYFIANQAPLNQAVAGYYNLVGDLYLRNEPNVAREFYVQGTNYGYNNHRSHYRLARLDIEERKPARAIYNYKAATAKQPTPHAYINLSNTYRQQNLYFDALFALQEGIQKFPDDGAIKNNLALLFSETDINDSTLYYLNDVKGNQRDERVAASNKTGFFARKLIQPDFDSLVQAINENDYVPAKANLMVLGNRFGMDHPNLKFDTNDLNDSTLNAYTLPLVVNTFTSKADQETGLIEGLPKLAAYPGNAKYEEWLLYSQAWQQYNAGNISDAFRQFDAVSFQSENAGQYQRTLGLLALEQGAPALALDYLSKAFENEVRDTTNLMLANLEAGNFAVAFGLMQGGNVAMIDDLQKALSLGASGLATLEDRVKYMAIRYRLKDWTQQDLEQMLNNFEATPYRHNALVTIAEQYAREANYEQAAIYLSMIDKPDRSVQQPWADLKAVLSVMEAEGAVSPTNAVLQSISRPAKLLTEAHNAAIAGDSTVARQTYKQLATDNPFFIWGCLKAATYFHTIGEEFEAYDLLRNAIDVNRYSVALIKAFVVQATRMKLDNYADTAIIRLYDLMDEKSYSNFEAEVNNLKNEVRESGDSIFSF